MKSITSLSGGKTSSMMALKYPTDAYVFAVVLTKDKAAAPKDKGLLRECQDRIPWFEGSREVDLTLLNVLRLEQELGTRIDWVASEFTFEDFIQNRTIYPGFRNKSFRLPNRTVRFCTEQLKLNPIFWHCRNNYGDGKGQDLVLMNIGFRWDESRRVDRWTCDNDKFKFATSCALRGARVWSYDQTEWRVSRFPMYENRIDKIDVSKFWLEKGWVFPEISNCDFCFHHRDLQQQRQYALHPDRAKWWVDLEASGHFFGDRPLKSILAQPLLNVFDDEANLCHCTD
jgi:hypothetical protein